jgi:hypothetical protein
MTTRSTCSACTASAASSARSAPHRRRSGARRPGLRLHRDPRGRGTYDLGAQLVTQATGVGVTLLLSGGVSAILFLALKYTIGIRRAWKSSWKASTSTSMASAPTTTDEFGRRVPLLQERGAQPRFLLRTTGPVVLSTGPFFMFSLSRREREGGAKRRKVGGKRQDALPFPLGCAERAPSLSRREREIQARSSLMNRRKAAAALADHDGGARWCCRRSAAA